MKPVTQLIILMAVVTVFIVLDTTSGETITVDDDGGEDYTSIQQAIDNAADWDVIKVLDGTYQENIVVDRTLTLEGNGKEETIIEGDSQETVVTITAPWVTMSGFGITGISDDPDHPGVVLRSDHNNLSNILCSDGNTGFFLNGSSHNIIADNRFESKSVGEYGIRASLSDRI